MPAEARRGAVAPESRSTSPPPHLVGESRAYRGDIAPPGVVEDSVTQQQASGATGSTGPAGASGPQGASAPPERTGASPGPTAFTGLKREGAAVFDPQNPGLVVPTLDRTVDPITGNIVEQTVAPPDPQQTDSQLLEAASKERDTSSETDSPAPDSAAAGEEAPATEDKPGTKAATATKKNA